MIFITFVKQKTVVAMKVQIKVQDFYKYPKFLQDNWVKTFLELIHVKTSQLVASLSTNRQQVVLVLLAPSSEQARATCNNRGKYHCKVVLTTLTKKLTMQGCENVVI